MVPLHNEAAILPYRAHARMKPQARQALSAVLRCRLCAARSKYFCFSVVLENDVYSSFALGLDPD